jgi:hypothetical protein
LIARRFLMAGLSAPAFAGEMTFSRDAAPILYKRCVACHRPGDLDPAKTKGLRGSAVTGKVHLHDMHATVLHLLGLDDTKLTYRYGGRNFRLTDVHGNLVKKILA